MIGEQIKNQRKKLKLSMIQLSEMSGVSQSTISLIENGRRNPSNKILRKLTPYLDISHESLIESKINKQSCSVKKLDFLNEDIEIIVRINNPSNVLWGDLESSLLNEIFTTVLNNDKSEILKMRKERIDQLIEQRCSLNNWKISTTYEVKSIDIYN